MIILILFGLILGENGEYFKNVSDFLWLLYYVCGFMKVMFDMFYMVICNLNLEKLFVLNWFGVFENFYVFYLKVERLEYFVEICWVKWILWDKR